MMQAGKRWAARLAWPLLGMAVLAGVIVGQLLD